MIIDFNVTLCYLGARGAMMTGGVTGDPCVHGCSHVKGAQQ